MAETLSLQVVLKMVGALTNPIDFSTPHADFNWDYTNPSLNFSNGTGANQANMIWHDQRSITTAGEDLDLAGSLVSPFGTTITFTVIKGLLVYAAIANPGNVIVSRPASNGFPLFTAASDGLAPLKPGGVFLWTDPSAGGTAVTGGTGDLINFDSSSGTCLYDVWIWGEV